MRVLRDILKVKVYFFLTPPKIDHWISILERLNYFLMTFPICKNSKIRSGNLIFFPSLCQKFPWEIFDFEYINMKFIFEKWNYTFIFRKWEWYFCNIQMQPKAHYVTGLKVLKKLVNKNCLLKKCFNKEEMF